MTAPVPCPQCEVEREAWRIARVKSQHNYAEATRYRRALERIANASNTSWLADMARAAFADPDAPPFDARPSTSRCTCDVEPDPRCERHNRIAPPAQEEQT